MRIVICASSGDLLFSGASLLSEPPSANDANETADAADVEMPASGVFPIGIWEEEELVAEGKAAPSGIFPRSAAYDEASMDESMDDIDSEWESLLRLSA
jgi:hypothetical protein